ncbi:kinase-like protein [Aspergillus crustosus]
MEIIQKNEAFKKIDGKMKFSYVQVFVSQDGILYSGKWTNRLELPQTLKDLEDVNQISTQDRGPKVVDTWSAITREIEACEILRKNPHPNIVTYYGYNETRGRVSGLCFKRYKSTLLEAVNPGYLGKVAFLQSTHELVADSMVRGLDGILSAIKHLHSLGLVHNDINPANIMLDEDGTLILIDFDSCRYIGESLRATETKRTHHWHDPSVDISLENNDLTAFRELQIWLAGLANEDFLFQ